MLFADDAIKVNGCLFLFANNFNMLFSINLLDGELTFLGGIPEEHTFSKGLTCKLVYVKEHIIVVPLLAKKIWVYSLKNKKWDFITIEKCKVYGRGTYFRQAIRYRNSLILIGGHYPAIVKMDLPSCKLTYLKKPFLNCVKSEELYFRGDFVCKEDVLYLASGRDNTVLIYHLDSQTYQWVEVGRKENRYSGIMWDGKDYWLSPRKNTSIVKWDGYDGVKEYEIPEEKRVNGIAYAGIIKKDNQIIIPALAGSGAETIILTSDRTIEFNKKEYFFYKKVEEGGYLAQDSNGQILFIDAKGRRRQYECKLSDERFLGLLDAVSINANDIVEIVCEENNPFSLHSLLTLTEKVSVNFIQNKKDVGLKVWEEVKQ